ncbi:LCP family protein [Gulosibacter molinativorax]|uniref:LytR family transcriptional regulator n=1 Tax=Gulosibacter molinativorax TaxID=256821 RepID=A0ABT7C486_9MICO|nr:LCP family protein [Gulosibacter molinativorax]MDJ1370031.1 LytR family transcriptional regulator [Gulosibacter molinativorax]QUY63779.1 Transcriptional regulator [Gulosibacter molinativorax]
MSSVKTATKGRGKKIALISLASVLVLLLVAVGLLWWHVQSKLNEIETIENAFPDENLRPDAFDGDEAPLNILLLGSDSREDSSDSLLTDLGSRADTIMVAHISGDRESIQLMSIMRDSYVEIPGHGEMKINAALSLGGVPLMVQTVEGLIDQRIDHVAMIDFNGFKGVTDALGGVTVHNQYEFSSAGYDFPIGPITLDGEQALVFVRERYSFTDGDYQRVANQQLYLKAVMSELISRDTLTNPGKLNDLLSSVTPYVATDSSLDGTAMFNLATSMTSIRTRDVNSFTLPTTGTGMEGDQSVVYVDWDELETVREKFATDDLAGYHPAAKP